MGISKYDLEWFRSALDVASIGVAHVKKFDEKYRNGGDISDFYE
ncbi:MAG: hypothetical protein OXH31_09145 [Gammaproteobacteria bacterium]|nr:hypothetical protein [Gammaproteobacteria bacterium]